MKKLLTFLVAFGLVFGTYGIASAAGSATLDFSPDTDSVTTGESFNLDVTIAPNGEDLDTVRVVVSYPANMLEVTSYSLGSVFPSTSPGNSISNATGSLSQGAFKTGGGVSSSGTVGTITFRALSAGTASIAFGTTSRAISAGVEKLSITGSGSASITIAGDAVAGEAESTTELTTEQNAIGDFGTITGYSPTSDLDWLAIDYMVNGYSGERDLAQEQAALAKYVEVFGATPSTSYQWNVLAAIAYSGAILDWDGAAEAAEAVEEAVEEVVEEVTELTAEEEAIGTFGSITGGLPTSDDDWEAVEMIVNGYDGERDLAAETAGLDTFISLFGHLPENDSDWNTVAAIAYLITEDSGTGEAAEEAAEEVVEVVEEVVSEASLEQQALVYFGAFYGYMPSTDADWSALHCFAYGGCQADIQDVDAEGAALVTFGAKYGTMPATSIEWNVVHTLAYTEFLTTDEEVVVEEVAEEVVEEVEEAVEEVATEASLEQQALVYFGAFYGYLPSTDADWSALHCFAYGGCQGDPQDVDAEGAALVTFGAKYGTMPATSIEWNVVHTLAYTDFLATEEPITEEPAAEEPAAEEEDLEVVEVVEAAAELSAEEQAIGTFGALTGALPTSDADWNAIDIMVNGYDGERDLETETAAMDTFISTFGAVPETGADWNTVAAIAYSGAF